MARRPPHEDRATHSTQPPVLILTSLAGGEKHGYALIQDIEAFAGVRLGPGTLYGALSRLEERGLVEAVGEPGRRRPYRLSPRGADALRDALGWLGAVVDEGTTRLRGGAGLGLAPGGAAA